MSDFKLSLQDMAQDPIGSIVREQSKYLVNKQPYATSNSVNGVTDPCGVFSMSEIMQGIPSIGSTQDVVGFQEQAASSMLGTTLNHKPVKGVNDGSLASPVDFLVPDDIRSQSILNAGIAEEIKPLDVPGSPGSDNSASLPGGGVTDPNGTQPHGATSGSYKIPGGEILTQVSGIPTTISGSTGNVKTNATMLMKMPNYQFGFPHHNWGDDVAAGNVKPELIKCLMYLCQVVVPYPIGLYSPLRQKANGPGISNHCYHAAIDVGAWAWPDTPTQKLQVISAGSDDIIRFVYAILNSLTGLDRPDEIGGPPRLHYDDNDMPGKDGPFYQNSTHAGHIHIGFEYATVAGDQALPPDANGLNGVRTDTQNDNSWSVLPTLTIVPPSVQGAR